VIRQAESSYSLGDFRRSRELAVAALIDHPDDVRLLRLAGRAAVELDLDAGLAELRRAVQLAPDDADAWLDLASALISVGETTAAADALRHVVSLRPTDAAAMIDLAHLAHAQGQTDEAIARLQAVLTIQPNNLPALRSLVEMQRDRGNLPDALAAADHIGQLLADDVVARLDAAHFHLALGNYTAAAAAYAQLRSIDPEPQHVTYAYHGMIHVELQRSNWRRALDHAIEATGVDRDDLTTELLAFTAARLFGGTSRATLSQAEIEAVLTAEHLEHRRQHAEELPL
jgi:tetratricopeptide (TPR) repeat protein